MASTNSTNLATELAQLAIEWASTTDSLNPALDAEDFNIDYWPLTCESLANVYTKKGIDDYFDKFILFLNSERERIVREGQILGSKGRFCPIDHSKIDTVLDQEPTESLRNEVINWAKCQSELVNVDYPGKRYPILFYCSSDKLPTRKISIPYIHTTEDYYVSESKPRCFLTTTADRVSEYQVSVTEQFGKTSRVYHPASVQVEIQNRELVLASTKCHIVVATTNRSPTHTCDYAIVIQQDTVTVVSIRECRQPRYDEDIVFQLEDSYLACKVVTKFPSAWL